MLPESYGDHERWRDGGVRSNGMAPAARATGGRVDLDVSWLVPADLSAVDALARLQLAASRRGWWLQCHGADGSLVELVEFVGLGDVVHLCRCCRSCVQHGETPTRRADRRVEPPS
jgi:hypothetical protein